MRWEGREQSTNIDDRRGQSPRRGGGKGPGIIGIIVLLVGAYYGVDLSGIVGGGSGMGVQSAPQTQIDNRLENQLSELSKVVLRDTEKVWSAYFQKHNAAYQPTVMTLYTGGTQTACGYGQSATGPFYCPGDKRVYLDLSFYEDMRQKLGAEGDTAFAYVIAHEVGHHIQNLTGTLQQVNQAQQSMQKAQANALSVKLELQADCYAGIWGHYAAAQGHFDETDLTEAFNAAEAVGDDRIQQRSQGHVVPDSFTHGTSAQRLSWFKRGLESGDPAQCNPFAAN